MSHRNTRNVRNTRREFLRSLGLSAAALPFLTNLPGLAAAPDAGRRKQRLVILFSPDGVVPSTFCRMRRARHSRSKKA